MGWEGDSIALSEGDSIALSFIEHMLPSGDVRLWLDDNSHWAIQM